MPLEISVALDPRAEGSAASSAVTHIRPLQARLVRLLMGLIMFVTGSYVGVDWAAYFHHFQSPYPAWAGYARTVLCAVLVAMIGPARLDDRDLGLLGGAFAVTLVADYCLILHDWMIPGTLLFVVVHGLLIARHARGFAASLRPPARARTLRLLALTALGAYGGAAAIIAAVAPILDRVHMFALDAGYLCVVATSMWMGWGTLFRGAYARGNAVYIAIGMTCFFCCDVAVGIAAALDGRPAGAVLTNMVGLFYSPALILLAYSGYHWEWSYRARQSS